MHTNGKKNAISVTTAMLGLMPHVRVKNHGFVTFSTRKNHKVRMWGRVVGSVSEKVIKKAELPTNPLPDGVVIIPLKKGAVTRYILTGSEELMAQV